MKKTLFFISLCCSFIMTAQHDITYNLEKGGVYPQNQTITSEQQQVINGIPQNLTTIVTTESDYIVTDIKDDIYHIDIVIKKMSNETKSAMGREVIVSDGPVSNPMNGLFKNMITYPIKITMSNKGEVLSFDNSDQLEGLTEGIELPEMQLLQIKAAMIEEMSPEKQTSSYNQITRILPPSTVAIGDTWEQGIDISSIATFEAITTFKLESVTDDFYTVSCASIIKSPKDATTDLMGVSAKYDLSGPLTGTYTIDRKTGWTKKAETQQELDGAILVEKSETIPQEMKMTIKSKTSTVIE